MAPQTNTPSGASKGKGNGLSKKDAVRQALQKLGKNAKPAQLRPYIKATFGLDMTPEHITTAKGEILRGKGKSPGKRKQAPAKPAVSAAPASTTSGKAQPGNGNAGGGIRLQDVAAVKDLVGRVGPDSLRTLIDLLAR
jgi:hypothetical protein